jgi:hypothetical protein
MSEGHNEEHHEEGAAVRSEPEPPPAVDPARPRVGPQGGPQGALLLLALLLVLIVAGVALSPFWAPTMALILPWGESPTAAPDEYAALAARVAAIEKRPGMPNVEIDAIKSAVGMLGHRVDQLEATSNGDRRIEESVAAVKTGLQQLDRRLGAIEAQSAARTSSEAADRQNIEQELSRLGVTTADLARRLPALEREVQSRGGADRTDAVLTLLLLQMREAVEQARPFSAEYEVFTTFARDPDLTTAAEPLAEAARSGVASRAVLTKRLAELAGQVVTAAEPPGDSDWGEQALARLRGLVTIRRIAGSAQTGPEAAVSAGQAALARGDLAGAIAALDPLAGANGEAARPWLRMARERLAVETALDHLQKLLTVRLDRTRAAPASAPPNAPREPSEKVRSPS